MEVAYFFDTYAIIETLEGNRAYGRFADKPATITVFNLAELYWSVLNKLGRGAADEVFEQYRGAVVEVDDATLKEAMTFRKKHKRQRLSYADCVGYTYAVRNNMRFLTGDKEFKGFEQVEYVK